MKAAGQFSLRWVKVIDMLSKKELNGYRDVEQLRKEADKRFTECVEAEKEKKQQVEERARIEWTRQKRKKTLAFLIPTLVIVALILAKFLHLL